MLWETVKLALKAIFRNALRSFLTVLGVVIGVAAVIAMVTVGQGSSDQVTSDVEKLGTNILMISPGQARMGPGSSNAASKPFEMKDVDRIAEEIALVETAAPMGSSSATVVYGNENYRTQITATDSRYLMATDWPLIAGRNFNAAEEKAGRAVCIMGETVRLELFGSGDPVGQKIRIGAISCEVIGLLEPKGASTFGQDQDDVVMLPMRLFQRRIAGNRDVGMIYVAVRDGASTDAAKAEIDSLLREIRRISPGEDDDFNVRDMKQIASMLTGINDVLTGMLSAVAAVSLLVGGIGIMNIMLVSVTERTREIGIRLAVGAQARQVMMQFLVEAVVLSLLGGVLGILLGLGLAAFASNLMSIPFAPDPTVVLMAFAFSAVVGVIFGYFPARAAARMDPIEALRHQ
ncbi:putative ABC transport system permease protein [Lutimaribacter pacificus]|uniref:Putative ABC transport system permease protein n=1 Tax=Lutimaribacter pacificus TaxID=391948 RepID=A0A1H0G3C9_9RHOB|nr:ABC transporter permease [Lutimaribacter pacificus]SDO01372.1 putative ABC transport system permease protein [Lutimaribacter pacificus]SHJ84478.1 putative ABC transport system permease protein [Lutimaribacter pacificus]